MFTTIASDEQSILLLNTINCIGNNVNYYTIFKGELFISSDGMMLEDKLKAAGVSTNSKNYDGGTHEFFGMAAVVPQAKDAQSYVADQLKSAFK